MSTAAEAAGGAVMIGMLIGLVAVMLFADTLRGAWAIFSTTVAFALAFTFAGMLSSGWTP